MWSKTGVIFGANISIEKKLPMGSGLGGGSSDAATTMMALNKLWKSRFSREELMALGLNLGADVPFFLLGYNAFAEGIGERLRRVETPNLWFVIIDPGVNISTRLVFLSLELTRSEKSMRISGYKKEEEVRGNDLEDIVAKNYPEVKKAMNWLAAHGNARMTGSGACVFCGFTLEAVADKVMRSVPGRWKSWKVKSMKQHPLKVD
jgi:4-diphosphocytidyl-2-C-methyl-D-erythritol kinase